MGIRGWLLLYMVGLGAELAHGLGLTIGSLIIYANPSLAGRDSFIPLWALLIYVVSNLGLVTYGVVLFVLMLKKRRAAIANNILFNALSVAFLVNWFFLGAKSPIGTVVDSLPALAAIAYFSRSRRVRNTFTTAPRRNDHSPTARSSYASSASTLPVIPRAHRQVARSSASRSSARSP